MQADPHIKWSSSTTQSQNHGNISAKVKVKGTGLESPISRRTCDTMPGNVLFKNIIKYPVCFPLFSDSCLGKPKEKAAICLRQTVDSSSFNTSIILSLYHWETEMLENNSKTRRRNWAGNRLELAHCLMAITVSVLQGQIWQKEENFLNVGHSETWAYSHAFFFYPSRPWFQKLRKSEGLILVQRRCQRGNPFGHWEFTVSVFPKYICSK